MGNDQEPDDNSLDDMSDGVPVHTVFLDTYEIDKYEVTVEQYMDCLKANYCKGSVHEMHLKTIPPKYPITGVSWAEATAYCKWRGKRLPTEAEWEKAARGPANYTSPWGNEPFQLGDAAIDGYISPVGRFPKDRSGYGVYDMAGNVQEWVADWYGPYRKEDQRNPIGPRTGENLPIGGGPAKVVRGGAFITNVKYNWRSTAFSTWRSPSETYDGAPYIGFRCAKNNSRGE